MGRLSTSSWFCLQIFPSLLSEWCQLKFPTTKKSSSKTPTFDILSSNLKDLLKTSGGKATDVPSSEWSSESINMTVFKIDPRNGNMFQNPWDRERSEIIGENDLMGGTMVSTYWRVSCHAFSSSNTKCIRLAFHQSTRPGFNLVPQKRTPIKKTKKNIPANSLWPFLE